MSFAYRVAVLVLAFASLVGALALKSAPPAPLHFPHADATPLGVTFNTPRGTDHVDWTPTVVVSFSKAIVPLGDATYKSPVHPFNLTPPASGQWRWIGSRTVTFAPAELKGATRYRVTVPAGLVAQDGSVLAKAFSWTFETPRPAVYESSTSSGSSERVTPNAFLCVRFNQPIHLRDVEKYIHLHGPSLSTEVPIEVRALTADQVKFLNRYRVSDADELVGIFPRHPLQLSSQYHLVVGRGYRAVEGDLEATEDHSFDFSTHGPLTLDKVDPRTDISPNGETRLTFSNPVGRQAVFTHLRITPPIKLDIDKKDNSTADEVTLYGPWKPTTTYHYVLSGDLVDIFGQKLGKPIYGSLVTGHYDRSLSFKQGMYSLEAGQPHDLPVCMVNLHGLDLGFDRLAADTIVPWLNKRDGAKLPDLHWHSVPGTDHDDVVTWKNVSLPLGLRTHGLVWVQMADRSNDPKTPDVRNTLVQITDLALNLKTSAEDTLVWVTSLSGGQPVPGAHVQLRDVNNRVLWRGVSDATGIALAPGWHGLGMRRERPLYAIATRDDDTVVVSSGSTDTWAFDIESDSSSTYPSQRCFMFTERGLYRAGETVHVKGMWRELRRGHWLVPRPRALTLTPHTARGDTLPAATVQTDDYGSFSYDLSLDGTAPSGNWSVTAEDAQGFSFREFFQVQPFRPVTFEVQVKPQQPVAFQGDGLQARVDGRYLFGAPVGGGKVTWSATLSGWSNPWTDFADYDFDGGAWLDREDEGRGRYREETWDVLTRGSGDLSADGLLPVAFRASVAHGRGTNRMLTLEATVEAPGHQQVSGRTTLPLMAADVSLGLKASTEFLQAGQPLQVKLVALDTDGHSVSGRSVHLRLVRRQWDSVRHDPEARWDTLPHDSEVQSVALASGGATTFKPQQAGFYYIEATLRDSRGRLARTVTTLWVWGGSYVAWSRGEGDRLTLVADKRHYKPGDTAHVMIQNPYESAQALVTVERETVMQHQVLALHGSAPVVDIPLGENALPNVYVSVVLIQGRHGDRRYDAQGEDVGSPSFKQGYLDLPVDASRQHVKVQVRPDHARYGPGDVVTVHLQVRTLQGQGVPAQVTLAAVDLGVLNLIGYQTPDAFDDFYGSRPLAVENAETRSFILGSHKLGEKGAPGGGGGADASGLLSLRHDFKMTAYWNPAIRTDAHGEAVVSFKLPDNLSAFRLMAVAQTRDSQFGSSQAQFVVNKPLVLLGSIPRFATVGDHFSAGVTLTNHTPQRQSATVRAQVAGGLVLQGPLERTVDVPAEGTQLVTFDFQATEASTGRMVFAGTMNTDTDTLELTLPVEVPRAMQAAASGGDTETEEQETILVPANSLPGSCRLEVGMASTAMVSLRNALKSLVDYPYGCLEQKLSKVYPMVLGGDLASQFNIPGFNQAEAHRYVADFIAHFPTYQKDSGGCSLWGGREDTINPWVSCYALVVLTEARHRGYEVPDLRSLQEYVSSVLVRDDASWEYPYNPADRLETRCLALYALSLAGQDVGSSVNQFYDQRKTLSLTSQALLMRTMARCGGFKGPLDTMVADFQNRIQLEPTQGYIETDSESEWVYYSRVRTTAIVLAALLDAGATAHAPDMMRWLLKHSRGGEWGTTQDNAWCLEACLAYLRTMEHDVPDFTAKVVLDGEAAATQAFVGRSTAVTSRSVRLSDASQGQSVPLFYHKSGPGRLYYTTRLFYAPRDGARWARDEGLAVDKHVTTLDGKEVTEWKAGQMYRVELTVASPIERTYVVVNDPVPAGFEVVNTNFETESRDLLATHGGGDSYFGSFNHFETYDDRVLMYSDWLYAGSHTFSYWMRAMYPGEYWQASTRAEAMYEPDVYGGTPAGQIVVQP